MGNILRTLRQKDTFYGDYVTGFHVVHRCIERSFEKIEHTLDENEETGENHAIHDKGFRRYVSLCIQFLSLHHKQEDKHIFPKFGEVHSEFKGEIDTKLHKDHEEIEILLKEAITILKTQSNEEDTNDKISVIERSNRLKDIARRIQSIMPNHLGLEEKYVTETFLREHVPLSEVYELHDLTHNMIDTDNDIVDGGERMDRKSSLVFLLYNLTEQEREFFNQRLRFFLKRWLIPKWANVEGAAVFSHAPFCRADVEGNLIF